MKSEPLIKSTAMWNPDNPELITSSQNELVIKSDDTKVFDQNRHKICDKY